MNRKKPLIALAIVLILVGTLFAWRSRPDPQFTKVKALQQELLANGPDQGPPTPEQRQKWEKFRAEAEKLKPEQRTKIGREFGKRFDAELARYVKMSPAEKTQYLDQQITRMEQRRQQWQQANAGNAQAGGRGGPGGGPGFFGAGRGPGGDGGGQPGGAPNNRPKRTPEELEKRRKERLDQSTADQRAQRELYFRDLEARRKQLGLPSRGPRFF